MVPAIVSLLKFNQAKVKQSSIFIIIYKEHTIDWL